MVKKISKIESAIRGAGYGAAQQPRDVIAALYASALSDMSFDEALNAAKNLSLSGRQGEAIQENPTSFGVGQLAGNIGASIIPSGAVTKAIGASAPILSKAPLLGKILGGAAAKIGTGAGVVGTLGQGAVQGAVSTGITDGDLETGAIGGAIGNGLFSLGGKIIKPFADGAGSAVKQGYKKVLEKAGIDDLTIGQMSGGKGFETIDSVLSNLPFTAGSARDRAEGQLGKFTKAALKKAGVEADLATPDVLKKAEEDFSNKFSSLIKDTNVSVDDELLDIVSKISGNRLQKLGPNKPIVESYLRDIVQSRKRGPITGEAYQEARSNLTSQARSLAQNDPFTAKVLRDIRNGLDDAAERALEKSKPELVPEWRNVRREYANYKTIQDAAGKVSKDSLEGYLSPAALLQSATRANPSRSQKGYGDLYELARAGRSSLTDSVPNSGTAQRQLVQQLLTGGGVGAGTYGVTQDPQTAIFAGMGTVALPKVAQSVLNSNAAKQYVTQGIPLLNKFVGKTGATGAVAGAQLLQNEQTPFVQDAQGNQYNYPTQQDDFSDIEAILNQQQDDFSDIEAILNSPQKTMVETQTQETLPTQSSPFLDRVAMAESGGNPNARAKTSSASGMYQFTDPTWKGMVKNYGAQTGITEADKNNPDKQRIMADLLTKENTNAYKNAGITPDETDLYMAHFLGAPSAVKARKNLNAYGAELFPKAATANKNIFYKNGQPRTVEEIRSLLGSKIGA